MDDLDLLVVKNSSSSSEEDEEKNESSESELLPSILIDNCCCVNPTGHFLRRIIEIEIKISVIIPQSDSESGTFDMTFSK